MSLARILKLLRNKFLGPLANAGACPMPSRLVLLRLCGWRIAPGVHVFSTRFLNGRVQVGEEAMIAQEVFLHDHAQITIGRHTWIGPRCTILTQTHEFGDADQRAGRTVDKPVTIGDGCWLGGAVTVLPGVSIGHGCVIAAGAVVTRDCKPDGLYAGVPAVRKRDLPEKMVVSDATVPRRGGHAERFAGDTGHRRA
jgi:maltose O-acetyltransferase